MSTIQGRVMRHTVCFSLISAVVLSAFAVQAADEAEVVVSGSRFPEVDRNAPANISVISAKDIAQTPAANLAELLATRAGVDVRSLYGGLGADGGVDIRGFGENGHLRTLILVDGRRLDGLDFTRTDWSSIPSESIDRIEITRGSGAVMFGDQAVGGVVNIITRRGKENSANISAAIGSLGFSRIAADVSRADTPVRFSLNAEQIDSNEYRRRNAYRSTALAGRLATDIAGGEAFLEIGGSSLLYELPGLATQAQYDNDPRAAETNDSWFKREGYHLRPGFTKKLTATLDVAVEVSASESHNKSWISNFASYRDTTIRSLSFSPRARWTHGLGGMDSVTVFGADWAESDLTQDRYGSPSGAKTKTVKLERNSAGLYLQNTTLPTQSLALTFGARTQRISDKANDSAVATTPETTMAKTASEFGLSWHPAPAWKVFAKASKTFRYAVLDEQTTFGGFATPFPKPESGMGTDVGLEWRQNGHSVQITHYDLKMVDEIAWNNVTFQNENLQKTLHRGVEVDSRWKLGEKWLFNLSLTTKDAKYREGVNVGKTIALVPTQRWATSLNWSDERLGQHTVSVNHSGTRYAGGDDSNVLSKLSSYTTWDWQSRWSWTDWSLSAKLLNLTDVKYSPIAYDFGFGRTYYPANPRSIQVMLQRNF